MQIITFFSQRYQRGFPGSELAEFNQKVNFTTILLYV